MTKTRCEVCGMAEGVKHLPSCLVCEVCGKRYTETMKRTMHRYHLQLPPACSKECVRKLLEENNG